MKFTKLVPLFAFLTLAVLSLGFATAGVLTFDPSSISQNILAGQSATISFNLNYTGTVNIATLTWTNSISAGTISNPSTTTINPNQSISLNTTINIPLSASGTVTAIINVSGPNSSQASLPITITVIPVQSSSNISISAPSAPITLGQNTTLNVNNNGNTALSILMSETGSSLFGVTFAPQSFSLSAHTSQSINAILSNLQNLKFGLNTINVKASAGSQVASTQFQVRKTFCSSGAAVVGNLSIINVDWNNYGNGDDNSWELLDEVELEVEVRNNNNDDSIDAIVEFGLYDSNGNNQADNLEFLSDSDSDNEQIDITIDDDDEETVTWIFKVPADFDSGNYKLAIKVYDDDAGESRSCRDNSGDLDNAFYQSVDVKQASKKDRYVVVDDITLDSQVSCGQTFSGRFTVFNVGKDKEDRVKVTIRNKALNINQELEITSKLNKGDNKKLDFISQVPANVESGNYPIEFITEYNYKNGVYRQDADEAAVANLEVIGCSVNLGNTGGLTNLEIKAKLDSVAKAGEELRIIATIKNTGSESDTYSLSARGYSSWAELTDISHTSISVDSGESKDVTFTLLVDKDSSGTQAFDIQATSQGKVQIQEVEVLLSKSTNILNFENPIIWVIGFVNLILVILIVVVAVKLSRR
ncbi:putative S-layer protein [Candidatus Pacearchaeota archaeon]|nr:putative S-layer protein [Candidatus Pacearchaeota archaeon]